MPAESPVPDARPGVTRELGLIESLHAGPAGVRWPERHLARMAASAAALGMPFPGAAIAAALERARADAPSKLRVVLAADGTFAVELAALPPPTGRRAVAILARARVDSGNRLLRHKTTARALYEAERRRLAEVPDGFDAIFLNERDELAEGAISNVFLLLDGRLATPPVACGLLPGVMRAHAIAAYGAEERVLTPDDLKRATRVYLSNAVRGMVEVAL